MKKIIGFICFTSLILGCQSYLARENDKFKIASVPVETRNDKIINNHCFKDLGFYNNVYGTTFISPLENDCYYKYELVSDLFFEISCGRGGKEYFLSKQSCSNPISIPKLVNHYPGVLHFRSISGSHTWLDKLVCLSKDTVFQGQFLCFDTLSYSFVEILTEEYSDTVYFRTYGVLDNITDTLLSNYHKYVKGGNPETSITNVYFHKDYLFYSIYLEDKQLINDSLYLWE